MSTLLNVFDALIAAARYCLKQGSLQQRLKQDNTIPRMPYQAQIIIDEHIDSIQECFKPELHELKSDRASYTLKKSKSRLLIDISAHDATALRAVFNSISKLLIVFEKTILIK